MEWESPSCIPESHRILAEIRITYLNLSSLDSFCSDFAAYAKTHWPHHFRVASPHNTVKIVRHARSLCDISRSESKSWIYAEGRKWLSYLGPPERRGFEGLSPLMIASVCGLDQAVRMLLEEDNKSDVDVPDEKFGRSTLSWACEMGSEKVVETLLDFKIKKDGPRLKPENQISQLLFLSAVLRGFEQVVRRLIEAGVKVDGQPELLSSEALIKPRGVDVGIFLSRPPLLVAVMKNNARLVRPLVDEGADINVCNDSGDAALLRAAYQGNEELVQYLLEKGTDVNVHDNLGVTALMSTARYGHGNMVQQLLGKGANVKAHYKKDEWTPLWCAVHERPRDVVEQLAERGYRQFQELRELGGLWRHQEIIRLLRDAEASG
ncbi:ankyrin repeat-containing domain protein [Daldinia bambusicola]|nr:ankyrin repeat-containing domain protein [Daldinia bambusicola]